jgi:hypothetical protein
MTEYVVGPGVAQAMSDHGDEPRGNETFVANEPGSKISETYGRDGIYYWLEVDNAVRRVPFR